MRPKTSIRNGPFPVRTDVDSALMPKGSPDHTTIGLAVLVIVSWTLHLNKFQEEVLQLLLS